MLHILGLLGLRQGEEEPSEGKEIEGKTGSFVHFEEEYLKCLKVTPSSGTEDWRACIAVRAARRRLGVDKIDSGLGGLKIQPVYNLPLRFTLARGAALGIPADIDSAWCEAQVSAVNAFWAQAGIKFVFAGAVEVNFESTTPMAATAASARETIWAFRRDQDRRTQREMRRIVFLNELIPYHGSTSDCYDIHLFDFIGQTFQGCCIDRESHSIIMGVRSNKGYAQVTRRPDACLAKTMAHELGHALQLNHPRGQQWPDGSGYVLDAEGMGRENLDNIMVGGADRRGGGGRGLEEWQIMISRMSARHFLKIRS